MKKVFVFILFLLCTASMTSQSIIVTGTTLDSQNQRKLDKVEITIIDVSEDTVATVYSNLKGYYEVEVDGPGKYTFITNRNAYRTDTSKVRVTNGAAASQSVDLHLTRLPGYEFQADVKELISINSRKEKRLGKELQNLRVEIFNNTSGKEVKVTDDTPDHTFEANFERGNHYTILLRKKGYYAKRIEVNVDIYGCILCFEGLGNDYAPEIESATDGNDRGILLTTIPMKKIVKDEVIRIENIYYDFDQWTIRPDAQRPLDDLVQTLKQNPIRIELRSHTDARGSDEYNLELSNKRAKAATDYLVSKGVKPGRMSAVGYGETVPLNHCTNGVKCSEAEYQHNRRTEFKVTGILEETNFSKKTLQQILTEEKLTNKRMKEIIDGL